jgi:hypothetical protein
MAELRWHGDKAMASALQAATKAIQTAAADLQGKSAMQAPVDTGDLRANCSVSPTTTRGDEVSVTVGYDLPYAIVQHEHLEYRHPKGGKAKFLEDPYKENEAKYKRSIQNAVKQALVKE